MCTYCGCGVNSVGSASGITPASIIDTTSQGESGLTSDMVSTMAQKEGFIEEEPLHEMGEGMVDPD